MFSRPSLTFPELIDRRFTGARFVADNSDASWKGCFRGGMGDVMRRDRHKGESSQLGVTEAPIYTPHAEFLRGRMVTSSYRRGVDDGNDSRVVLCSPAGERVCGVDSAHRNGMACRMLRRCLLLGLSFDLLGCPLLDQVLTVTVVRNRSAAPDRGAVQSGLYQRLCRTTQSYRDCSCGHRA